METLRKRSKSPQVRLVQRLINLRMSPRPKLVEDSIFGRKTHAAVKQFQGSKRLADDGIVGSNTWGALGIIIDVSNRVILYGQPTNMTCWSAAATMLLGTNMSIGPGNAALGPRGGLLPSFNNVKTFADGLGLYMHPPQCWTTQGLAGLLHRGTIWVAGWVPPCLYLPP